MTGRIARFMKRTALNPLLCSGRKPRIVPMSREDERLQAEINRRREERRKDREHRP